MRFKNFTPYPAMQYSSKTKDNQSFEILIAKMSYGFGKDFELYELPEQELLNFTDLCFEDFNTSSLKHPSDLVPIKPNCDVIVIANSHSPKNERLRQWNCGIRIDGEHRLEKQLMVYGPRQWNPIWSKKPDEAQKENWQKYREFFSHWELSEPELSNCVPIRYEYAYGGLTEKMGSHGEIEQIAYEHNPIGVGWIDQQATDHTQSVKAAQIESIDEPIVEPYQHYAPQSLGPIPPAWLPRRPLGGTYDQNWIDNIWPEWPQDYDFSFHNSAPMHMQYPAYMTGKERIQLMNLWPEKEIIDFNLPGNRLFVHHIDDDDHTTHFHMKLDTVYVNLAEKNIEDCYVSLTWRYQYLEENTQQLNLDVHSERTKSRDTFWGYDIKVAPNTEQLFQKIGEFS